MRLLICTQAVDRDDPTLGFFHRWLEEFAKHCESITVICLQKGVYSLPNNITVYSLGKERGRVSHLRYALRFWKILFRIRGSYDAIFVHMNPEYVLLGGWWWRLTGKSFGFWYVHKSVNFRLRVATLFSNYVFTASKESFRLASRKVLVMGHGIDVERARPRIPKTNTVRLITSGRVTAIKHLEVILEAFLLLKKKGIPSSCTIFGAPITENDSAYQKTLFKLLTDANEKPETVFFGAVPHDQLPEFRAAADYFLHASDTGSLDKSVLDAAVSGVLPLSSSEAYKELFGAYESVLAYPKGDSQALAERIIALEAMLEEKREEMRKTLYLRVIEKYSLASLIPNILARL